MNNDFKDFRMRYMKEQEMEKLLHFMAPDNTLAKSANFSECRKFRYTLLRQWDEPGKSATCIGLNPSNANAEKDDPTIRLLMTHLAALGYVRLVMTNLYALISSKPDKLWEVPDNQGQNDEWLDVATKHCDDVIFCWGSFRGIEHRAKQIIERFPQAKCFGKTKTGAPTHPMALMYAGTKPGSYKLQSYRMPPKTVGPTKIDS